MCGTVTDFDTIMGHEIALTIKQSRDAGEKLALILPVGPMGMYRWAVFFLKEWGVSCDHVYGFNMDEWSDSLRGNTLPADNPGAFQYAMKEAFYGPLGRLDGSGKSKALRDSRCVAELMRKKLGELKSSRCQAGSDLRNWSRLPHCVLGTALCRRIQFGRRMESTNTSYRCKTASR